MAIKIANRVKMTVASVASSGTGDITLGSSVPGYLTFAEGGVSNADTTPYVLEAANGDWEIGTGTYTSSGTVLARTTVTKSSIGGVIGTSKITASSTSIVMISPLAADMQSTDTLTSGTLGVARGGTGQNTYTIGDILYASATGTLSLLAAVATGNALISGGTGTAPSWGKVGLTTHVSGTLPVANGGTGLTSLTAGYIPFGGSTTYGSDSNLFWDNTNKRLGVGTSSPGYGLHLSGTGTAAYFRISNTSGTYNAKFNVEDTGEVSIGSHSSTNLWLLVGNSTKATLDTAGNLGLGVTPSAWNTSRRALQIGGNTVSAIGLGAGVGELLFNAYTGASGWVYSTANYAGSIEFNNSVTGGFAWKLAGSNSAGSTISFTQAMTLDASGVLSITKATGTSQLQVGASSNYYWDISRDNDTTGALMFRYKNGGSVNEAARIDSSGNLLVGTTGGATGKLYVWSNATGDPVSRFTNDSGSFGDNVVIIGANRNTTNNSFYALSYYNYAAGAYKFRVADSGNVTNTNNSYTGISDIKLKQDISDAVSQWEDIKGLRIRKFRFKDDPTGPLQLGVIAQEIETTSPGLIDIHADKDADGNDLGTVTKAVKYSVLYMKAVKALQEALIRIEALEAKVG